MSASGPEPASKPELRDLDGVGPVREGHLQSAGLTEPRDLVAFFPRRVQVRPPRLPLVDLHPGLAVTLVGRVARMSHRQGRRRRGGHLSVRLEVEGNEVLVQFFNQGWLKSRLEVGQAMAVSGAVKSTEPLELSVSDYLIGEDVSEDRLDRPLVAYPPINGIKPGTLKSLVEDARRLEGEIGDPVDAAILERRSLMSLSESLAETHAPATLEAALRAEARLIYNGFLARALRIEAANRGRLSPVGDGPRRILVSDEERDAIRKLFPFELTGDQDRSLNTIFADLASDQPMRRLVQGDVGCGKTAVACAAAIGVAANSKQVSVLVPTEALARQFFVELKERAGAAGLETRLLLGSTRQAERKKTLEALAAGELKLIVGTHAVFGDRVRFRDLALVIVDEQHRFGVLQRLKLVRKGRQPHLLAMSATPIPRTLAMTLYSDLDATTIRERPPGRKPVETLNHVSERDGKFDWASLANEAREGAKIFVVFPAVESETASIPSLLIHGRALAKRFFRGVPVAALHGRMAAEEKAENLEAFRTGRVRVLFATTVIEVGVDVPDAGIIVIVGANRFGLAQLHQLRGRVGRGGEAGRCILLSKGKAAADSERLNALLETDDGFEIAERDLDLRGPGDIMGLRQHGLLPPVRRQDDSELLESAFEDARTLLDSGANPENLALELEFWSRKRLSHGRDVVDAG